ncbi:MAG: helix-turn-helix domain-containing protein [Bacteroidaceae bacterium]|nr:helix-turn-helix domain-containing protein [Bacteroidaceae bacterium]
MHLCSLTSRNIPHATRHYPARFGRREDIRYQLLSTDHTFKEITSILGFPNISFFGKYVKQHFGISPTALREQKRPTKS